MTIRDTARRVKQVPLRVKQVGEADGLAEGEFIGYASVFGNLDSYGDIVDPGAFTRTLTDWKERGETIPVLWGHDMADPFANIGGVVAAEEDHYGLRVHARLDLDNPTAAQVHRLVKGRRTSRMSFAYAVRDAEKGAKGVQHLKDLELFEVSIVQVPANELAEVTAVKATPAGIASATDIEAAQARLPALIAPGGDQKRKRSDMDLKDRKAAAIEAAETIFSTAKAAGRDLTSGELAEAEKHMAEVEDLTVQIGKVEKSAALISRIEAVAASHGVGAPDDTPPAEAMRHGAAGGWAKATFSRMTAAAHAAGVKGFISGNVSTDPAIPVAELPRVPTRLLDLIPREISGATFEYLRQVSRDNNAGVVADGDLKPTSAYAFEEVRDRARVIAHLSEPYPERFEQDHGAMIQVVHSQMLAGVWEAVEDLIVNGTGDGEEWTGILHTTGTLEVPYAGDALTSLRRARTRLEITGVPVTGAVLNPSDIEAIELMKDEDGRYLWEGDVFRRIFGGNADAQRVVGSVAVPEGTAILGNFGATSLRVTQGEHVLSATQSGELFYRNQKVLRAEGRYGFGIAQPGSLAVVALAE